MRRRGVASAMLLIALQPAAAAADCRGTPNAADVDHIATVINPFPRASPTWFEVQSRTGSDGLRHYLLRRVVFGTQGGVYQADATTAGDAIFSALIKADFEHLERGPQRLGLDGVTRRTAIRRCGKTFMIEHGAGDGPPPLLELERQMDEAAANAPWQRLDDPIPAYPRTFMPPAW